MVTALNAKQESSTFTLTVIIMNEPPVILVFCALLSRETYAPVLLAEGPVGAVLVVRLTIWAFEYVGLMKGFDSVLGLRTQRKPHERECGSGQPRPMLPGVRKLTAELMAAGHNGQDYRA